ncbi:EVE domain-containing protein [Marinobacter salsuginis]|uniref:hypothetical protein n=1 Tax=Marinobacter salsuginis TaxID=418719 RepID=UPI001ADFDC58|nr:hypothetical protein [Marinobacter salsuginis]QTN40940.1 hypothetical protein HZ997_14775 [Marinobacter salsuginis]
MKRSHFILIKHPSETTTGRILSATDASSALLEWGFWPLFEKTRCRLMVQPGNSVLIYTAGQCSDARQVIASAQVAQVLQWNRRLSASCPIFLEGIPVSALQLTNIQLFTQPVVFTDHLDDLSFIPANRQKWGVAMMGGMRSISQPDYQTLTAKAGAA